MSNITFMRLTKLQPLFHMVSSSYAALANPDAIYTPDFQSTNNNNDNNASSDKFLVLFEEDNYNYRSTSTIVLMVAAWILLILGFVFCCCAECFGVSVWKGKKQASALSLSSAERGAASVSVNANELSAELHADRANHSDATIEVCRHCPPDYEVESLPSYTIVSGLPTYDDALEEFRKAGIILTPNIVPVIKIFENVNNDAGGAKEPTVSYSLVETTTTPATATNDANADSISLSSITCNCGNIGGAGGSCSPSNTLPSYNVATAAAMAAANTSQIIELSPEHLASLSQKRLSLQISFNNSLRRRTRNTLHNHLLRSRAVGNTAGLGPIEMAIAAGQPRESRVLPPIHRSNSTVSLSNERQLLDQRLRHLHHRGSLY